MSTRLLDRLASIVGAAQLLTDPDLKAAYETDWTRRFSGSALAVVRPGSTDEVVEVLRACSELGASVVPQGGNTGLVGGSVPRGGEVVLSTLRLRSWEPVDVDGGSLIAGAGVTLASAQQQAAAAGWAFGVDLAARDSATIGGMIATNAGGLHVLRHGTMRAQLLGVEAVLADGSVVRRLSGLAKDNTGYDLAGLLCGSEGTLGVITRARLCLVPPMPRRAVALLALPDTGAAISLTADLRRSLPSLMAAELFFEAGLRLVLDHTGAAQPFAAPAGAYLLLETAAQSDPSDDLATALTDAPGEVLLASDQSGRSRLWQLRERHTEAISAAGVVHKLDVSVPLDRLAGFVERLAPTVAAAAPSARVISYGHLAEGNLHVSILGPAADDESADEAVLRLVIELGGSISAEHGIGIAKVRWLEADRGAADVAAMRAVKRALDPAGVLNPGVLFDT